jgi:hypothetical protein
VVASAARPVIHARAAWIERLVARLSHGVPMREVAGALTERDLERVPALELAETEEHNDFLLERERGRPAWRALFERAARRHRLDAARLEAICCQHFILAQGRHASQLRHLLRIRAPAGVPVASDLPLDVLEGLGQERYWEPQRLEVRRGLSALLRALAAVDDLGRLAIVHLKAAGRTLQMRRAPARRDGKSYVAWLGAGAPEMAGAGETAMSLPEFLRDALAGGAVDEIVVQGRPPQAALPAGVRWIPGRFVARVRPGLGGLAGALLAQACLLAGDLLHAANWRRRQLLAPALAALPGTRLWFETDAPRALLYANSVIGGEPLAAALAPRFGVETMMLFYSANVAYVVRPARARLPTDLEPEMRYIAAGRLGMWSPEMAQAFGAAGYAASRLPVTGVVHYGRQAAFRRRAAGDAVRVGIFDVSSQTPARRFLTGWGQTLYHAHFCRAFFTDVAAAAEKRWGKRFVLVRKPKRELDRQVHADDVDLSGLVEPARLIREPAGANLWHVLAGLDMVICMPFTSVAFMAEQFGIPAAYYDPLGTAQRSSLAGRAPLLSGRAALERWLAAPAAPAAHDASINVAAETLKAACALPWTPPALAQGS